MVRGPYYDKNGLKRGAWSKEEDERLRAYVERCGHSNWRQLPRFAGLSRCGKSCRLRWVNYLRPNLKRGNYTQEEEKIIIKLHEQHGNKWSLIAEKLPGRSDNEIKNHWHSSLKKRLKCNHEMTSEFKMNHSDTSERERTQYTDSGNPILDGAPSHNILESSLPKYTETSYTKDNSSSTFTTENWSREGCNNANIGPWENFEEFSNFWTEPFIVENTYSQDNYPSLSYAANEVDLDEYVSYFFDNTEFLCQVMQELPKDLE